MLELGWSEIFVIMILILLLVGPKEIPVVMRNIGRIFRRLQYVKYALSKQFEDFMHEADLDDLRRSVNFETMKHEKSVKEAEFNEAEADEEYMAEIQPAPEKERPND